MGKFFKNVFMCLGVLLLSAAILYFLIQDKQTQEDVLQASLSMFGERLLAMIPQQSEKDSVQQKYDEFMRKAEEQEVDPEKIEIVAAEILTASTTDEPLPAEDAIALLDYALGTSSTTDSLAMGITMMPEVPVPIDDMDPILPPPPPRPKAYVELGKTLKELNEFTIVLEKAMQEDSATIKMFAIQVDSGIKIVLDDAMKEKFLEKKSLELEQKLKEVERMQLLRYRRDLDREVREMPRTMPAGGVATRRYIPPNERKKIIEEYIKLDSLWVHHGDSTALFKSRKLAETGLIPPKLIKP